MLLSLQGCDYGIPRKPQIDAERAEFKAGRSVPDDWHSNFFDVWLPWWKKSPTIGNAILIADALHISLDTLVGKKTDICQCQDFDYKHASELSKAIAGLTEEEQNFLLDIIKSMRHRLKN